MAKESASARFLYNTAAGRLLLKGAVQPWVSRAAGAFLSSPLSKPLIPGFVKKNGIDLSECETGDFSCFNDCFTRKLRDGLRPVDKDPDALISPCDGLLSAYEIRDGLVMPVKQSMYSVADLLGEDSVELFQALDRKPKKIFEGRYWGDPGFIQICYDVTGMKAFKEFCASKGHPFTVDSCPDDTSFDMGDASGHFCYVEDPDGYLIELVETHKIPVVKKLGWFIDMKKRDQSKSLPRFLFRMMGLVSKEKVKA